MWNSFASYFVSGSVPSLQNDLNIRTEGMEDDWVLIDITGKEISKGDIREEKQDSNFVEKQNSKVKLSSPLSSLNVSITDCIPQETPPLSPSKMEGSWFVTPPPCFTASCPQHLEVSPLEDLLIEHPSMSVYGSIPPFSQRKSKQVKDDIESQFTSFPNAVNQNAEGAKSIIPSSQILEIPKITVVPQNPSQRKKDVTLSSLLEKSGIIEQIENIKPAQHAKWLSEQYKLHSSYIDRQNRVHHYQSRNHPKKQRKSYLLKTPGAKSKHSY